MACMPLLSLHGKDDIQYVHADRLEATGKSTDKISMTFLNHESCLKDGYSIPDCANLKERVAEDFLPGASDLSRQDLREIPQEGIKHCGESSNGYSIRPTYPFIRVADHELSKWFTLAAELNGRSPSHVEDLDGVPHERESPGEKHCSLEAATGRSKFFNEEFLLSDLDQKLQFHGLDENAYTVVIEDGCFNFAVQFGDSAMVVYVLGSHDAAVCRYLEIQNDIHFPMQSMYSLVAKEERIVSSFKGNRVSKQGEEDQHIDFLDKAIAERYEDRHGNLITISEQVKTSTTSTGTCLAAYQNEKTLAEEVPSMSSKNFGMKGQKSIVNDQEPCASQGGGPPEGLFYVLPYMQLHELLALEQVSRSLRDAVRDDLLLWKSLHIEHPLSKKVTDEVLVQLSARSQGQLQCLSLLECVKVTEYGIRQVLDSNPMLTKLCLPGCTRVNADAVVAMVREHTEGKSLIGARLKQLRIRGLYGITKEHVEQLHSLLLNGDQILSNPKPQYYRYGHYPAHFEDDRLIDVEVCPKCANVRVVYDCTRDRCQQRQAMKLQQCRGCTFCIARCEECGTCIDDTEYEETFCLDLLCSACWLRLPKCVECNRPGCGKHVDHFIGSPDTYFLCADCHGYSPGEVAPEFYAP